MARTALTATELAANTAVADPSGASADSANGMNLAGVTLEETLIRVVNGSGSSINFTLRTGVYPPALSSGQGDLVTAIAGGATKWFGPFTSQHFAQKDGSLNIDFSSATSVTLNAFHVSRKA